MKEYLKAQSKTNEIIVGNMIGSDELDRFSKSDFRWADNRKKPFRQRAVKKGEIYQFEFAHFYERCRDALNRLLGARSQADAFICRLIARHEHEAQRNTNVRTASSINL